jgi:DNA-binding CsgD family transcriptional regulator
MEDRHFTPRQLDVIVEMCKGKPNKEIARALGMAEATVKLHLTEIFKTLGVRNRSQAIIKASNLPITTAEPPPPLTDQEILETFTNTAFKTLSLDWSDRVVQFGQAIDKRARG